MRRHILGMHKARVFFWREDEECNASELYFAKANIKGEIAFTSQHDQF